jgi:predicted acyl esterase
LTPNQPEAFAIRLPHVGHTFLPGHRVRIEITSSAYPGVHPNPNTGNPIATDTESKIAHQTVYHDGQHPSHVLLPVLSA